MITNPITNPSPFETFAASTAPGATSTKTTGLGGTAPSEQMFLQLLVAQIKNQDPTSPSDPSAFVAQLAQFSQLEQVIAIRQGVDSMNTAATATTATTATTSTGTTGTTPGA